MMMVDVVTNLHLCKGSTGSIDRQHSDRGRAPHSFPPCLVAPYNDNKRGDYYYYYYYYKGKTPHSPSPRLVAPSILLSSSLEDQPAEGWLGFRAWAWQRSGFANCAVCTVCTMYSLHCTPGFSDTNQYHATTHGRVQLRLLDVVPTQFLLEHPRISSTS